MDFRQNTENVVALFTKHMILTPVFLVLAIQCCYSYYYRYRKVKGVPVYGGEGFLNYWITAFRYATRSRDMIKDGFYKYDKTFGLFQIPTPRGMHVIVGSQLFDEYWKAPSNTLNFNAAINEALALNKALGPQLPQFDWHTHVLRQKLPALQIHGELFREEISDCLDKYLASSITKDDWTPVRIQRVIDDTVAQTTSRIFVGPSYCRNKEYLGACIDSAVNLFILSRLNAILPVVLVKLVYPVVHYFTLNRAIQTHEKILGTEVATRQENRRKYGDDWKQRPNDIFQCLIEQAPPQECDVRSLVLRLNLVNFAAIHTTSMTTRQALMVLAAKADEYLEPLREEAHRAIKEYGWTKEGINQMKKLDSFIKETARLNGFGLITMNRITLAPFTFSNGITVPKQASLSITTEVGRSADAWGNAHTFDGFRYSKEREKPGQEKMHTFSATGPNFVHFGHGKIACPGRFMGSTEVKMIVASIILDYDIKAEPENGVNEYWMAGQQFLNPHTMLLFRKRA